MRIFYIILLIARYYFLFFFTRKRRPKLLRKFFEEAGGVFIKFGQILALRVDVLPKEYCLELIDLFDHVRPFSYKEVEEIFIHKLGATPDKIFKLFEKEPFASASLGQVHAAKLANDKTVIVKVRRPDIESQVNADFFTIDILAFIGDLFFKIEALPWKEFALEFKKWTILELDYRTEAINAQKIYDNVRRRRNPEIVIPKTYHYYTTKEILVQEYIDGIPLNRILKEMKRGSLPAEKIKAMGLDLKKSSNTIAQEIFAQYFLDDFFHADPHPGNFLILEDNKVAVIDFGIVGESVANKYHFAKFLRLAGADLFDEASYYFLEFGGEDLKKIVSSVLPATVEQSHVDAFTRLLADHLTKAMKNREKRIRDDLATMKMDYTVMVLQIIKFAQRYRIKLPKEFSVFIRALTVAGFVLKEMDNDLSMQKKVVHFFSLYPEDKYLKNVRTYSSPRINREKAVEKLNSWLSYLIERDPELYTIVNNYFSKYNVITR